MTNRFRVVVTGSRDHTSIAHIADPLVRLASQVAIERGWNVEAPLPIRLAHGDARGADTIAARIARDLGWEVQAYPARWAELGDRAGLLRNQAMLDKERPDVVLAFPLAKSIGTWDCVRRAKAMGIRVQVIEAPRGLG